ncbi:MAG: hypothetical protein KDD66_14345 [Bdellovibrionales bacterium]|nr:hypothetical protein [Bdellovibrionales bacterium]
MLRRLFFALLIVPAISCSGMSKHSSFTDLTATDAQKKGLLQTRVDEFNREVYWGVLDEAATFIEPEAREGFRKIAKVRRRNEKIVDQAVDDMEIKADENIAWVDVRTRYFNKRGSYYVKERLERQTWRFHRAQGGWLFAATEEVELEPEEIENGVTSHAGGARSLLENTWSNR